MTDQSATGTPDYLKMEEGLPPEEIDRRIGLALAEVARCEQEACLGLLEAEDRKLFPIAGFPNATRYAMEIFGVTRRDARKLLAAARRQRRATRLARG